MGGQLPMLVLPTLPGIVSATSSQESRAGLLPLNLPVSPMITLPGVVAPPVSLTALPMPTPKVMPTSGILLPPLSGSSHSVNLQLCLASKLKRLLNGAGSTIYSFTWKDRATRVARQYCQLVASARSISVTEYCLALYGWQTPKVSEPCGRSAEAMQKRQAKRLETGRTSISLGGLAEQVEVYLMGSWPTAKVRDDKGGYLGGRIRKGKWSTDTLDVTAQLATPCRLLASGVILTGSDAKMENSGQLNPAHPRWLMGYPKEWDEAAFKAWQSNPRQRKE